MCVGDEDDTKGDRERSKGVELYRGGGKTNVCEGVVEEKNANWKGSEKENLSTTRSTAS